MAEVMSSNPVQVRIFFRHYFHYCLSSVYYCEDRFGLLSLLGGSVSLTDIEVQTFLEGEENQYTKLKTKSFVFSDFGVSISLG